MGSTHEIEIVVNDEQRQATTSARTSLADFLRDELGLTGTHLGCEHGVCGACTVLLDGAPVRSCVVLAAQADRQVVTTIEGAGAADGSMSPVQEAFCSAHALQCGYCTPGMVLATQELLERNPRPTRAEIDDALGGNICRCTGYVQIREAVELAAEKYRAGEAGQAGEAGEAGEAGQAGQTGQAGEAAQATAEAGAAGEAGGSGE